MFRVHRLLLAGLISAAVSQPLWAEDLLTVYRQAADSDPQIKAADATRQANLEAKPQARALLLPTLSARGGQLRNFNVESDVGVLNKNYNSHEYDIGITQPVFHQDSLVKQRQADITVKQSDVDYLGVQQSVLLQVAERYFGVLSALDTLTATGVSKWGWRPLPTFTMRRPASI
jgi:outer membrane protein